ncbi:MAG TPA: hypothetical protein VFL13_03410 [Candidatus Baltobacteraceae bacterium]|nr:hypothetical protein [Candidatus Baltobacteraceae bacterium]
MASETKTFSGIDRARMNVLRERAAAFVQLPQGDSGAIDAQGVRGSFSYDDTAQTLTITLDHTPLFVPRSMVWSTLESALRS